MKNCSSNIMVCHDTNIHCFEVHFLVSVGQISYCMNNVYNLLKCIVFLSRCRFLYRLQFIALTFHLCNFPWLKLGGKQYRMSLSAASTYLAWSVAPTFLVIILVCWHSSFHAFFISKLVWCCVFPISWSLCP